MNDSRLNSTVLKNALQRALPAALFRRLYNVAWRGKEAAVMGRLAQAAAELRGVGRPAGGYPPGVNLIGHFRAADGLGESARLLAAGLGETSEALSLINVDKPGQAPLAGGPADFQIARYDMNIVHINPVNLDLAWRALGRETWAGRYNIGFWLWELEEFPAAWSPAFGLFDEIWTPSEFVARAIRKKTSLPVAVMPYGLSPPLETARDRAHFGLPEGVFLFLTAADSESVLERKNPLGAVEAFTRAFPHGSAEAEKAGLILKIRSAPRALRNRLEKSLAGYPHIYFMEKILSRAEVYGLIKSADAFVSLHRAEGFGLVLAEAMFLGTPCVATAWSANTEFMPPGTAGLVAAEPVRIGRTIGPFLKTGRWAAPDLDQAAAWLRRLVLEPALGPALAAAAAGHVRTALSRAAFGSRLSARLAAVRAATGRR